MGFLDASVLSIVSTESGTVVLSYGLASIEGRGRNRLLYSRRYAMENCRFGMPSLEGPGVVTN